MKNKREWGRVLKFTLFSISAGAIEMASFALLNELLHGNMGESSIYRRPVAQIIAERFVNSFALMLCAWILAGLIGFALGCVMGMYHDRMSDKSLKKLCYVLSSVPTFWLGLLLLLIFSVWLGWFPIGFSSPIGVTSGNVTIRQKLLSIASMLESYIFPSGRNIFIKCNPEIAIIFLKVRESVI